MIRCLKRLNYPAMRAKIKKQLAYSDTQANKVIYLAQQREAIKQVKIAFKYLQEDEMAMFPGNKSYFRCKQEGLEVLAKDDKEYLVISDNNKVKNEGQLLFCCLRTSNKYKRDECGGALRRLLNFVDFRGFQRFSTSATCDQNGGIIARFLQLDMHYS